MPFKGFTLVAALVAVAGLACSNNSGAGTGSATGTASSKPTGAEAGAGSDSPTPSATATPAPPDGPPAHDVDRTIAHIEHLAGVIGPRVATTESAAHALDYIEEQFEDSGYIVERHEFTFDSAAFRPATVELESGETLEALGLNGGAEGSAVGAAVFVGSATAADVAGIDLDGKIAVGVRDLVTFQEKYEAVTGAGAAGLVLINHSNGPFTGRLQAIATIPVVGVGQADGDALRAAADANETLTITLDPPGETEGTNVIARPSADAACDVLVGGHSDTVVGAPGANDNASGTAHVLELARAFAADGLDEGLCFATFDAEEFGLFGSDALVQEWRDGDALPTYMVNLDVTGIGDLVELIGTEDLAARAATLARQLGIPTDITSLSPGTGSDHQSFQAAGVDVIFLSSGDFEDIHTPEDVVAQIDLAELQRVGELAYAVIDDLLDDVAAAEEQT